MPFHHEHLPEILPAEPLSTVSDWLRQAVARGAQPNPNAMVLATVDRRGMPSARVVLCKEIKPDPGYITFYTNYSSRKGAELAANPRAAVVMHWDVMHRQVRLEGVITRTTPANSDAYFATRAWQSRIGAWASQQSAPLASRDDLEQAALSMAQRFGTPSPLSSGDTAADPGVTIDRPPYWGGFHLWVDSCELWAEGSGRLHDRARWTRTLAEQKDSYQGGRWTSTRLQP
jgi:pyridoxamine 5'-phosphate oxidase